jgi:hypothetical protein
MNATFKHFNRCLEPGSGNGGGGGVLDDFWQILFWGLLGFFAQIMLKGDTWGCERKTGFGGGVYGKIILRGALGVVRKSWGSLFLHFN